MIDFDFCIQLLFSYGLSIVPFRYLVKFIYKLFYNEKITPKNTWWRRPGQCLR